MSDFCPVMWFHWPSYFQTQVLVSFMEIIENWFTEVMSDFCPVKPSQNLKLKRTCEIARQNFVVCSHRALHSCYKLALTWLLSKYWLVKLETPVIRAAILSQFTGSIGNAYWQPGKNGKDTIFMFVFTVQYLWYPFTHQAKCLSWKCQMDKHE